MQRKDLKSDTLKGSKTRHYQIVHTTDSVFLIVELAYTSVKNGTRDLFFSK